MANGQRGPPTTFHLNFLHHIDQGALGAYIAVRYINNKANDDHRSQ